MGRGARGHLGARRLGSSDDLSGFAQCRSNVWAKTTDLQVVSGHGCRVVDVDGNEYLDFTAGIAAASTGHCHPKVVAGDR